MTDETKTEFISQEIAQETALKSEELLRDQGFCVWSCMALRGESIVILNDQFDRLIAPPRGLPVYLLGEISMLEKLSEHTFRFINHIKKTCSGARIISVTNNGSPGERTI